MAQTNEVVQRLRDASPSLDVQVVTVRTEGDASPEASLAGLGRGIFVKELEDALLRGQVDVAVHSLKDLPTQLPDGLAIAAVCQRADPRDVLVNRWGLPLTRLPSGARIGTSSPRRAAQLKRARPDLEVLPMRGNVDTRLAKVQASDYDGAMLAAAGLARLDLFSRTLKAEYLNPSEFVPAPGQGALAVETRADDLAVQEAVASLDHLGTRQAVTAERHVLELLGSGCQLPMGAYGRVEEGVLYLGAFLAADTPRRSSTVTASGAANDPIAVGAMCYSALEKFFGPPQEQHDG